MKPNRPAVGLILLLAAATPVRAEGPLGNFLDRYFENCAVETMNTSQLAACLEGQYRHADQELNAVWPHVLRRIDSSSELPTDVRRTWRDSILKAQRAWVAYKEAECLGSAPFKFYQGTQANVESLACLIRQTALRLAELKDYLRNRRWDEPGSN